LLKSWQLEPTNHASTPFMRAADKEGPAKTDMARSKRFYANHVSPHLMRPPIQPIRLFDDLNTLSHLEDTSVPLTPITPDPDASRALAAAPSSEIEAAPPNSAQATASSCGFCFWRCYALFALPRYHERTHIARTLEEVGFSSSGHRLGSGASAEVVAGRSLSGQNCAIKMLERKEKEVLRLMAAEVAALNETGTHAHVVRMLAVVHTPVVTAMVFENAGDRELYDEMMSRDGTLSETQATLLLRMLCLAVAHCHERRVVHRDISPANMVLSGSFEEGSISLRLIDFGNAVVLPPTEEYGMPTGVHGTAKFCAPEVLAWYPLAPERFRVCSRNRVYPHDGSSLAASLQAPKPYSYACDVWSIGCVAHAMLCGSTPFHADEEEDIVVQVVSCQLFFKSGKKMGAAHTPQELAHEALVLVNCRNSAEISLRPGCKEPVRLDIHEIASLTEDAKRFVSECLSVEPTGRPLAKDLLMHRWVLG